LFLDGGALARSQLVRHHLAQWAEWSGHGGDPWDGRFQGHVDLDRVVLIGHSRGGEGVERAAIDSDPYDPWKIRGLVLIGPTAFGRQVAAGIHTAVILPFCDGDVADLQGQQYVDIGRDLTRDRALRASVMAMGTNHNYYNTEWTPGLSKSPAWDDWFDPADPQCGEGIHRRLTPQEQQAVGLAYTAALVDLAVADPTRALRLLDGSRV
jgi:pimeloyl-ACP methyl ester carboxylesterase